MVGIEAQNSLRRPFVIDAAALSLSGNCVPMKSSFCLTKAVLTLAGLFYINTGFGEEPDASNKAKAFFDVGLMLFEGNGVAKDQAKAFEYFRKSGDSGYAPAQYVLGLRFMTSGTHDAAEAVKWFRKAAEQGHDLAQYELGRIFSVGYTAVPKDEAEAVKWFRKAAEQGHAKAQFRLGYIYHHGIGVIKDNTNAALWLHKAAEQGDELACVEIASMLFSGDGLREDKVEAAKLLRKAASQGYALAQHKLGVCYIQGWGVPKDEAQAYQWLLLAAAQGDEDAKTTYIRLESELTPEMRMEGQRLAREFKPLSNRKKED